MGLIKTALKTVVAVRTANVVDDRIQRRKHDEWVAAGHPPESFPGQSLGEATATVAGVATSWLGPGNTPSLPTPPPPPQAPSHPAPVASGAPVDHVLEQLRELAALKESGILTHEEFEAQKQRILSA